MILNLTPTNAYRLFRTQKGIKSDGWRFRDFARKHGASGLTLDTGAKLYWSHTVGYFVGGYHYAGDDVKPFAKFAS